MPRKRALSGGAKKLLDFRTVAVAVAVIVLIASAVAFYGKARLYCYLAGWRYQTVEILVPCPDGEVTGRHITPAGDSLFTILCPKEGYDGT